MNVITCRTPPFDFILSVCKFPCIFFTKKAPSITRKKIISKTKQKANLLCVCLFCVWGVCGGVYVYAIKRGHIHEFQP